MLLGSGNLLNKLPLTQIGGVINNTNWMNPSIAIVGVYTFDKKSSLPNGYGGKAFYLPLKAGGVSSFVMNNITTTANGAMGINIEGSTSFLFDTNTPSGEMIVSGVGSSTVSMTTTANSIATLNGTASASFTIGLNHLAMYLDADGYASANLGILGTTTGTISALGTLAGSTVDTTGLTPASVWSYGNRVLTIDVATKGDIYASAFM